MAMVQFIRIKLNLNDIKIGIHHLIVYVLPQLKKWLSGLLVKLVLVIL